MDKQELIDRLRAKAKENGQKTAQYSDYNDKTYFTGIQRGYDRSAKLVDQLDEPEHEKVILPQAVGEEIDKYKIHNKLFKDYIEDVFSGQDYMYAIKYLANDNKLETLADAWRYGWKPEEVKPTGYSADIVKWVNGVPHLSKYHCKDDEASITLADAWRYGWKAEVGKE